jgi:dolichyl-phosphate-mannose--protein O-mannosyl transferase
MGAAGEGGAGGAGAPSRAAWLASLFCGLSSAAWLAPGLGAIATPYWDEGFYLTDARRLFRAGGLLNNPEHPPLGKWLLGLGIQLTGDDAAGRRLAPLVATVVLLAALPLVLERAGVVRRGAPAWLLAMPSLFLVLDPLVLVTARIATLDAVLDTFYVGSVLALAVSFAPTTDERGASIARVSASALCGLALGTKWTALTLLPLLAAACVVRDGEHFRIVPRRVAELFAPLVVAYVACFALPGAMRFGEHAFPISDGPLDPDAGFIVRFVTLQLRMIGYHTYYFASEWRSAWYEWLVARQPLWYAAEAHGADVRVVAAIGSPLAWGAGLAATIACLVVAVRERLAAPFVIAAAPVLQLALWAVALRMTFIYYMSAILPFYALALAWCTSEALARRPALRGPWTAVLVALAAGSLAWLLHVRPLVRGEPLSEEALRAYEASPAGPLVFHDAFPLDRMLGLVRGDGYRGARLDD